LFASSFQHFFHGFSTNNIHTGGQPVENNFASTPHASQRQHHASQFNPANLAQMMGRQPAWMGKLVQMQVQIFMFQMKMASTLMQTVAGHLHGNQSNFGQAQLPFHGRPETPTSPFSSNWNFNPASKSSSTRWLDEHGQQWHSIMNFETGQHTSMNAWSAPDNEGTYRREQQVHNSGEHWFEEYNADKNLHQCSTAFSAADNNGFQYRKTHDYKTGLDWQEAKNDNTGVHLSVSNWSHPDENGNRMRWVNNHQTGKLYPEHMGPEQANPQAGASGETKPSRQEKFEARFNEEERQNIAKYLGKLGLGSDATRADIRKEHKRFAKEFHPDKTKGNPTAEATFKEKQGAIDKLQDYMAWLKDEDAKDAEEAAKESEAKPEATA